MLAGPFSRQWPFAAILIGWLERMDTPTPTPTFSWFLTPMYGNVLRFKRFLTNGIAYDALWCRLPATATALLPPYLWLPQTLWCCHRFRGRGAKHVTMNRSIIASRLCIVTSLWQMRPRLLLRGQPKCNPSSSRVASFLLTNWPAWGKSFELSLSVCLFLSYPIVNPVNPLNCMLISGWPLAILGWQ